MSPRQRRRRVSVPSPHRKIKGPYFSLKTTNLLHCGALGAVGVRGCGIACTELPTKCLSQCPGALPPPQGQYPFAVRVLERLGFEPNTPTDGISSVVTEAPARAPGLSTGGGE